MSPHLQNEQLSEWLNGLEERPREGTADGDKSASEEAHSELYKDLYCAAARQGCSELG